MRNGEGSPASLNAGHRESLNGANLDYVNAGTRLGALLKNSSLYSLLLLYPRHKF